MKLIFPHIKQNLHKIVLGIICMIIVDATQLIVPQMVKHAIDTLSDSVLNTCTLIIRCSWIVILGLIMAALRYRWRNLLMGSARFVEKGLRDDLFRHVLHLDMTYFDTVKTGDIMAHATSDINHVRMAFGFGLIVLVDTILLGGATLGIMVWTHPKLTLFAMIPMPFLVYFTRTLGKKMHTFHGTAQASYSQLTELFRESFFGIRIIKVFNFETMAGQKVEDASTDYFKKNLKRAVVTALLRPLLGFFFNLSTLIVIFYGGYLVVQNMISPGELVSLIQYLGILAWPVIAIGWMTNLFQRGMASLKRISTLLSSKPQVYQPSEPIFPKHIQGRIQFSNIDFSYNRSEPLLSGLSFDIEPGQRIGISGPPGSGKTSLIQLMPRLYDPDMGQIRIDGLELKRIDLDIVRQSIALMPQESFIFSGTIRENVLMGHDAKDERLDQIIDVCQLTTTLEEMPQGLETIVGERGITLSGGQKQRIALARTLIREKPIIILDDPISQMDTQTASRVIQKINELNMNATFINVSHRISALALCDKIFILKNGRIHRAGNHEELIKTDRFYRDSYRIQQFEEEHHA